MNEDERVNVLNNMGQVLLDSEDLGAAFDAFAAARKIDGEDLASYFNLMKVRRASCDWSSGNLLRVSRELIKRCKANFEDGNDGVLLPFDATLLPVSNTDLLYFSRAASRRVNRLEPVAIDSAKLSLEAKVDKKLRIGYASFDFNDHPMGHLTAGFMGAHNRSAFVGKGRVWAKG